MQPCRLSCISVSLIILICTPVLAASFTAEVFRVIDGDTVEVLFREQPLRVSLHGVDCPDRDQVYGEEAKGFTSSLVSQETVEVVVVIQDKLGRIWTRVLLPDGRSLNRELVRAGLAWWDREQAPDDVELEALEEAARESRKGLWADPDPVPPWEYRRRKR